MTVIEVSIIHGGFLIFSRKYVPVEEMDEDVVSSAMYTAFLSLSNVIGAGGDASIDHVKMEIGTISMHVLRTSASLVPDRVHDFYCYLVVDKPVSKKRACSFLAKVFKKFIETSGESVLARIRDHGKVDGLDADVDALVKAEKKM